MKNIILLLTFFSISISASAQESFQKELFSMDLIMNHRVEIKLADDQAKIMESIYFDHITGFNTMKWKLGAEVIEMDRLLASTKVDEEVSIAQMKKVAMIEEQLKDLRLRMLIRIKNVLTVSQQKRLKELRTENDVNGLTLVTPINSTQKVMLRMGKKQFDGVDPLYILKDKKGSRPITKLYMQSIDPNTIASIQVYKDSSAINIYGKEAENGVVLIEIKSEK